MNLGMGNASMFYINIDKLISPVFIIWIAFLQKIAYPGLKVHAFKLL